MKIRLFDLFISSLLLCLLSPVMLTAWVMIRLFLGKPAFFTQVRPGHRAQTFKIYKFRSMTDACDASGNLLPDHQRFTPFGQFLRRYSIDELPQLWNVLKGDLSLVGPRPLLVEYVPLYNQEQARRHEVKPGITGWAQVKGRNALSWEEKFAFDVWYVDNQSLRLNLKILWLTFLRVIKPQGVNQSAEVTMTPFRGSAD